MRATASSEFGGRQPGAVRNALTVLEEVALCGPGVTAQELTRNLGLPRATTYRLLNLLVQQEYLVRMPDLSGFALGRKIGDLASLAAPPRLSSAAAAEMDSARTHIATPLHLVDLQISGTVRVLHTDPRFPAPVWPHDIRAMIDAVMGLNSLGAEPPDGDAPRLALPIHDDDGRLLAALVLTGPTVLGPATIAMLRGIRDRLSRLL